MALRAAEGASTPTDVFLPILLATYFATITGLIFVSIRQRINLFNKTMLLVLGGLTIFVLALVTWLTQMPDNFAEKFSVVSGNMILFCVILGFILLALKRKVDVYQTFIDGAKEGFNVGVKIIPYLVGMLISIAVFRASGTLDWIIGGIEFLVSWFGFNTDFVGALPTAVMKPLSGSGARAMMVETMSNYGSDSFQGFLSGVFQGSTETTFYTIAVYYGAINVTRTRYTATAGLFADFMGIVAAIIIAYIFW
jgi:spore maturation protein SpmB